MATTTLEIDGSPVSMTAANLFPARMTLRLRGISTLTLVRRGGALEAADPYVGKSVVLKIDGVTRFAGDVGDRPVDFGEVGWNRVYQCQDLTSRADKVPFTDSNTKMDFATWNVASDNLFYLPTRAGRSVGQILTDVLTMQENADALDAAGIGGYTSLSPPTLPAATVADLAAMTIVPPERVRAGGERLWTAIVSLCQAWAPNHAPRIGADGIIRFLDQRAVSELVLSFDDCEGRVQPSGLSRSVSECRQRVVVRGDSVAVPRLFTTAQGGLVEDFAWGVLDNAAAKADWEPADFLEDQLARAEGTMSVTDLTHVVLTSAPTAQTWGVDEWGPTARRGTLYAWYSAGSGINQGFSTPVVSNTAKTSGGTSTFTLERPLPATNFDRWILYGISSGASLVWRRYKVADPTAAAALGRRFSYPAIYVAAGGAAASQTTYPVGSVCWSISGTPPYNETPNPIVSLDPTAGTVLFYAPTYNLAGGVPADVRALLPVYETPLVATRPASGYEGTSHTVEGLEDTLVVTADSWRDPANQANVEAYAQDLLDSVKDAIVEGSVVIHKLYDAAFDFGVGLSLEADYVTGWEAANVPVVEVDVSWNSGGGSHHTTTLGVSNRRASYSLAAYMQPERRADDGTMGFVDFGLGFNGGGGYGSPYGDGGFGEAAVPPNPIPDPMTAAFGGGDSGGFDGFDMGPAPTSAKDPRSAKDPTSRFDPASRFDPRSARDDTPAGERAYDPKRKFTTARDFNTARKFDAPDRKAESAERRKTAADRTAGVEKAKQGNAAESSARDENAMRIDQANWQRKLDRSQAPGGKQQADAADARKADANDETTADSILKADQGDWQARMDREQMAARNRDKQARDDADAGQDWRDAP